jgi:hypothetical protein
MQLVSNLAYFVHPNTGWIFTNWRFFYNHGVYSIWSFQGRPGNHVQKPLSYKEKGNFALYIQMFRLNSLF